MPPLRVVVTGMGAISPFGQGTETMFTAIKNGQSAIVHHPELGTIQGMETQLAGLVPDTDFSKIPRKHRRSMSKMTMMALLASYEAIEQANLPESLIQNAKTGLILGSTLGSAYALEDFFAQYLPDKSVEQIKSMIFFKIMGHSVAANIAQALGTQGRILAPAAACATGCQAIGMAYELIAHGLQDIVICGGADEYHPLVSATFDMMQAASCGYNRAPGQTPRPFDACRDGIVCAEGAGVLVLESYDSAIARNAGILAEIMGFSTKSDASSIASPDPQPLYDCMREALEVAGVLPESVSYINAHATGTLLGDRAETLAIAQLVGARTPVSSLKGHMGHTMAASGALETIACIQMLRYKLLLPTRNLEQPDPQCQCVQLLQSHTTSDISVIVKNSFAMGGINCSLILRKYDE